VPTSTVSYEVAPTIFIPSATAVPEKKRDPELTKNWLKHGSQDLTMYIPPKWDISTQKIQDGNQVMIKEPAVQGKVLSSMIIEDISADSASAASDREILYTQLGYRKTKVNLPDGVKAIKYEGILSNLESSTDEYLYDTAYLFQTHNKKFLVKYHYPGTTNDTARDAIYESILLSLNYL